MNPSDTARPVALVTGAARRIGAAIARTLHAAGYDVALHYRQSAAEMQALVAELEAVRAGSTLMLQADLRDTAALAPLVEATIARYGRLDALVNNASTYYATPFGSVTPAQWDELMQANARAPFFLAQAAAPHLRASSGAIVNLADLYALFPSADLTAHAASKAALVSLTQSLALALAPAVRVNAIAPGAIAWPDDAEDETRRQRILAATPLKRTGSESDIAAAVRWLLVDARFCTGQVLRIDGGRNLGA
ncbi:MAG TPA: pteridine reductase [Rhodanobacteraceae bacterium]|nr:pteridine reductase [Rhodanobacteraceae bacterium]